jgi:hypothetical protein
MTEKDLLLLKEQLEILKECKNKWKTEMYGEEAKEYMRTCLKDFFLNIGINVNFDIRQNSDENYTILIGETITDFLIMKSVQTYLKGDYE